MVEILRYHILMSSDKTTVVGRQESQNGNTSEIIKAEKRFQVIATAAIGDDDDADNDDD